MINADIMLCPIIGGFSLCSVPQPFLFCFLLSRFHSQRRILRWLELNNADAEKAMELYEQLQDAQKQWQDFKVSMRDKYGSELVQRLHLTDPNVTHMATGPNQKAVIFPIDCRKTAIRLNPGQ